MSSALGQLYLDIRNRILSVPNGNYTYAATGTGATFSGTYCGGRINDLFTVTVDGLVPDTFSFSTAEESGSLIPITGGLQYVTQGIYIQFDTASGNTLGNTYTFSVIGKPLILFCQLFNDQFTNMQDADNYDFPMPAVFIEMVNELDIQQLGDDTQIYEAMIVRLHIANDFYNANVLDGAGQMEVNMQIFDIRNNVYKAIQKFQPTGAVAMFRVSEQPDYSHKNIFHFIQDYQTNLIDTETPGFGVDVLKQPPTDLDLVVQLNTVKNEQIILVDEDSDPIPDENLIYTQV